MENLTHTPETTPAAAPPSTSKPRSEAQIAASRANGAKSKGPKTPEGMLIASLNAQRHGLLSRAVVMEGENPDAYRQLSTNLIELFQPADEHEANLVETMLISMWRRHRALSMETCGLSTLVRKQRKLAAQAPTASTTCTTTHDHAFNALSASLANASLAKSADADTRTLDLLHRYEARHTRSYNRAVKDLFAYRKLRGLQPIPTFDQSAAEQDLADQLDAIAAQPESAPNPTDSAPKTPQSEPRAQASGPQLSTDAAASQPPQHHSLPNEPELPTPPTSQNQPNGPKPHANHPARNKFKKNRRRK